MTDVIVPETTRPTVDNTRMLISAVVRTKSPHLSIAAGTKAVIVSVRDEGKYPIELLVPGFPLKFWVARDDFEILEAPNQKWWELLVADGG